MSNITAFGAAGAPLSFVPRQFAANLYERFHAYDEARADFENAASDIRAAVFAPRTPAALKQLRRAYRPFIKAGIESALFIAYCMKNQAFMMQAATQVQKTLERELNGFHARLYADPAHLDGEMGSLRTQMFDAIDDFHGVMNDSGGGEFRMPRYHGDAYAASFLDGRRLVREDFEDWIEFHFLNAFHLPLGIYAVSPRVAHVIRGNVASTHRGRELVTRVCANDPNTKLNALFPGLGLDGVPKTSAQLRKARQGIAANAFRKPDITACVVETGAGTGRVGKRQDRKVHDGAPRRTPG